MSDVTYDIHILTYQVLNSLIKSHISACMTAVIRCILNNAHRIERIAIANCVNNRLTTTRNYKNILCSAILMQVIDTAYTVR